jgi:hypothetical protein
LTLEEITEALAHDTRPGGPDGCSNVDRINFVLEVFNLKTIDLTLTYDFTPVIGVDCVFNVQAAKHLALLKLDYINRLYDHFMINKVEYDTVVAPLILAVQRIDWHLFHLEQGVPTPPFAAFQ